MSAEDWPVQALAENHHALEEMQNGVNRHYKFAAIIFGVSPDTIKAGRARGDLTSEMQYYLGKKSRHANNYGMQAGTMSESLAREGYSRPKPECALMLDKVRRADPNVESVYHKYIQDTLYSKLPIINPFGRERQFFGLRQGDKNYKILNEAYAQIPQSTVADNNGLAVLALSTCNDYVIQDGHDSVSQELPDREAELISVFKETKGAYKRNITFHNGITINIPVEGELGYDFNRTVKIKDFSEDGVITAYRELQQLRKEWDELDKISLGGDEIEVSTNNVSVTKEAVA